MTWQRRRIRRRSAVVGALVFLLSACSAEHNPLFVGRGDEAPVIGWRECPGSEDNGIREIGLYEWDGSSTVDEPGEPLWRVTADEDVLATRVLLGSAPKGFTTRLALTTELDPDATYALRANSDEEDLVTGFLTFRPEQLTSGDVVFSESEKESKRDYDDRDEEQFGCFAD